MPFYEYQCSSCEHQLEVLQKISDAPLKKCPECGRQTLKRLISAPVFRLKGGGWYETDFKSDKEGKRNLAGGDSGDDSAGSSKEAGQDKETTTKEPAKTTETKTETAPAKPEREKPAAVTTAKSSSRSSSKISAKPTKPAKAAAKPATKKAAR